MGKVNIKKAAKIEQERQERKAEQRKQKVDAELDAIDKASVREIRAIKVSESNGEKPDMSRLVELEDVAKTLRGQREGDGEIIGPEWREQ